MHTVSTLRASHAKALGRGWCREMFGYRSFTAMIRDLGSMDIGLNCGVSMPRVGLGTFRAKGAEVQEAVHCALSEGLRCIDTASIYKVAAVISTDLDGPFECLCHALISRECSP